MKQLTLKQNVPAYFMDRMGVFYSYKFRSKYNCTKAMSYLMGAKDAYHNGFPEQTRRQIISALTYMDLDRAEHAVAVARANGARAKVFCVLPENGGLIIRSWNMNWELIPVDSFQDIIPPQHLRTLTVLRQQGIEFDGFAVAVPHSTEYEPLLHVLKDEALGASRALKNMGINSAKVAGRTTIKVAEAVKAQYNEFLNKQQKRAQERARERAAKAADRERIRVAREAERRRQAELKDPVLLVRHGLVFTEIGRWI